MSCGSSGRDDSSQKTGKLTLKNFQVCVLQGRPRGWSPVTREERAGVESDSKAPLSHTGQA